MPPYTLPGDGSASMSRSRDRPGPAVSAKALELTSHCIGTPSGSDDASSDGGGGASPRVVSDDENGEAMAGEDFAKEAASSTEPLSARHPPSARSATPAMPHTPRKVGDCAQAASRAECLLHPPYAALVI